MKTFIFLLILIIALFGYIFYTPAQQSTEKITEEQSAPTLEAVESDNTTDTIEEEMEHLRKSNKPGKEEPQAQSSKRSEKSTDESFRLTKNIQTQQGTANGTLPSIQEDITFVRIKEIIQRVNPHYPQSLIALNTPVASLLPAQSQKEAFEEEIASHFNINIAQVKHYMSKNRLLWDWVNMLRQ